MDLQQQKFQMKVDQILTLEDKIRHLEYVILNYIMVPDELKVMRARLDHKQLRIRDYWGLIVCIIVLLLCIFSIISDFKGYLENVRGLWVCIEFFCILWDYGLYMKFHISFG